MTASRTTPDRLYFRQLLAGLDFALDDQVARQMVNFVYLVGDRETGEAMIVDPAYGISELVAMAGEDGMRITGALVTHYHADHIGGDLMGYHIDGVRELLGDPDARVKLHVQRDEAEFVQRQTEVSDSDIVLHEGGDVVEVGGVKVTLLHTPGHTPGSQCFLVDGKLVAGDTLFIDGCGRTDFPGGDSEAMYDSLHNVLATVPDDTVLYPGHLYSPAPSATMADTRRNNYVFRPKTPEQWIGMFGQ